MRDGIEMLRQYEKVIVYGAGNVARALIYIFTQVENMPHPLCCIVSNPADNPRNVLGIPVKSIEEINENQRDVLVVIAAADKHYRNIMDRLQSKGFIHVARFTFESENLSILSEQYLRKLFSICGMEYARIQDMDFSSVSSKKENIKVYMAESIWDKKLSREPESQYASFLTPIQVGKRFSTIQLTKLTDDNGDNISNKNRVYSELTGVYWIWRNTNTKWVGMCHYRRHFMLTEDEVQKLPFLGVDVVLPVPIINIPSVEEIYFRDHFREDWNCMMSILEKYAKDYYDSAQTHFSGCWYYAYNMMITRKIIFDDYCEWLFPLLLAIEKVVGTREDRYQNRYIGFLAERLTSLYFYHHRHDFSIVHAHKKYYL